LPPEDRGRPRQTAFEPFVLAGGHGQPVSHQPRPGFAPSGPKPVKFVFVGNNSRGWGVAAAGTLSGRSTTVH
jgi:hypothetical protein